MFSWTMSGARYHLWSMTDYGSIFDGNNQDGVIGYQIEYSTSTFTPGDGTELY